MEHDVKDISPVFIVGCGRSGTTLLRLMLHRHSQLYIAKESYFIPEMYPSWHVGMSDEEIDEFARRIMTYPQPPEQAAVDFLGWNLDGLRAYFKQMRNAHYSEVVTGLYTNGMKKESKIFWGDKTPRYIINLPLLYKLFPQAKFVHLIRDGRDVTLSYYKCGWGPMNILEGARLWSKRVNAGRSFHSAHPDASYYEMKFEDLLEAPAAALSKLCDFIGIGYEEAMLDYHKNTEKSFGKNESLTNHALLKSPVNSNRINAWTREMSDSDAMKFGAIAGSLLREYGYEQHAGSKPFSLSGVMSRLWDKFQNLKERFS